MKKTGRLSIPPGGGIGTQRSDLVKLIKGEDVGKKVSDQDYIDQIIQMSIVDQSQNPFLNLKNEQDILKLLNPIIKSNSVWKNQVLKFLGDFYYSISQLEKAKQYYSLLLKEKINNISRTEINRRIKSIK